MLAAKRWAWALAGGPCYQWQIALVEAGRWRRSRALLPDDDGNARCRRCRAPLHLRRLRGFLKCQDQLLLTTPWPSSKHWTTLGWPTGVSLLRFLMGLISGHFAESAVERRSKVRRPALGLTHSPPWRRPSRLCSGLQTPKARLSHLHLPLPFLLSFLFPSLSFLSPAPLDWPELGLLFLRLLLSRCDDEWAAGTHGRCHCAFCISSAYCSIWATLTSSLE